MRKYDPTPIAKGRSAPSAEASPAAGSAAGNQYPNKPRCGQGLETGAGRRELGDGGKEGLPMANP